MPVTRSFQQLHGPLVRVFRCCDVARQRSFSQAAHANEITQSAVSQIVSQLERRMDANLIDRSTRPLQLTALGQAFYEGCKALLAQYDDLESSIRSACTEVSGWTIPGRRTGQPSIRLD